VKGISPVVSTVILISIAVVSGMIIYFWVIGQSTNQVGQPNEKYKIEVNKLNWTTGEFLIRNVDSRDMPAMTISIAQNTSRSCSIPALSAGESYNCTFGGGLSGELTFYGTKTTTVTLKH